MDNTRFLKMGEIERAHYHLKVIGEYRPTSTDPRYLKSMQVLCTLGVDWGIGHPIPDYNLPDRLPRIKVLPSPVRDQVKVSTVDRVKAFMTDGLDKANGGGLSFGSVHPIDKQTMIEWQERPIEW